MSRRARCLGSVVAPPAPPPTGYDWESLWTQALGSTIQALQDGPDGSPDPNEGNKWPQISAGEAGGTQEFVIAPDLGYPGQGNLFRIDGQGPPSPNGKVWVQRDEISIDKWPLAGLGQYFFFAFWWYNGLPDGMPNVPHHCIESHTGELPWAIYFTDNPTPGLGGISISFPPWEFWPGGSAADVHFYAGVPRATWHMYQLRLRRDPVDGESARPRVRVRNAAGTLVADNGDEGAAESFHHGPGTVTLAQRIIDVDVRVTGLTTAVMLQKALQSVDCGQSGQGGSNWLEGAGNYLRVGHPRVRVTNDPNAWPAVA